MFKFICALIPCLFFIFYLSTAEAQSPTAELNAEYTAFKKLSSEESWAASLAHARKAYEIGKTLFKSDDKNNASLAFNYGHNLFELKQYEEAEKILAEALGIFEKALGEKSPELVPVLMDIGGINTFTLSDKDTKYYDRVLSIAAENYGKDSIEYGNLSVSIGTIMLREPKLKARSYLKKGYEVLAKHYTEPHVGLALANFNLGRYELTARNYEEAVDYFNKTLKSIAVQGKSSPLELTTHGFLVYAYESLDQSDLATEHCMVIGKMTPLDPNQQRIPLFKKLPQYPFSELNAGNEGYASFNFDIDESGFVRNIKLLEKKGGNFEAAAMEALERWRYAPSFVDGKPVVTKDEQTIIRFDLAD